MHIGSTMLMEIGAALHIIILELIA